LEPQIDASPQPAPPRTAFTALANRDFRIYFFAGSAAMMADNIEHVISYWVIFQTRVPWLIGSISVA
jgi:hypothetical protein